MSACRNDGRGVVISEDKVLLAADSRCLGRGANGVDLVDDDVVKVLPVFVRFAVAVSGQGYLYDPERFDYSVYPRIDRRDPDLSLDQRSDAHRYGQVPVAELIGEAVRSTAEEPQSPQAVFSVLWAFLRSRLLFSFRHMPYQGPDPQFNLWICGWDGPDSRGSLLEFRCKPRIENGQPMSVRCEGKRIGSTASPGAAILSFSAERSINVD